VLKDLSEQEIERGRETLKSQGGDEEAKECVRRVALKKKQLDYA